MADEQTTPPDGEQGVEDSKVQKSSLFKRLLKPGQLISKKVLATILIISLLGHVAYLLTDPASKQASTSESREVTLGEYFFTSDADTDGSIRRVDFKLHVDLLAGTGEVTRRRLDQRSSMVQQNVEQLLRRARAVDFTDPVLAELKRQLQETINETISLRGISDVIITDLVIERHEDPESKASVASHQPNREGDSPSS